MQRFLGKTVLVTGGNSGIGLAAATAFAREGAARVIITGQNQATLDIAAKSIGPAATAIRSDAGDIAEIRALGGRLGELTERVDAAFVNAGSGHPFPLQQADEQTFDRLFAVNVKGPYFLVQQLARLMPAGGTIVLNGSILAHLGMPGMAVYGATKAALISMIRTLSAELLPHGIRVNAVSPGPIDTPAMTRAGLSEEARAQLTTEVPLGRLGRPEEVAEAVLFLASAQSAYAVGTELILDGGMTTR